MSFKRFQKKAQEPDYSCRKCGFDNPARQYLPPRPVVVHTKEGQQSGMIADAIMYTCECGYVWYADAADAEEIRAAAAKKEEQK